MQVDIAKPVIGDPEIEAVVAVLRSGRLIQGPLVAQFEARFAQYHGASFGVAVCNGTVALTAALMAHRIGPGDEVIVPAFSFFATASSVLSVGARPVFADIDEQSFNLDVDDARSKIGPRTRAIMPVHLYGLPADMEAIATLAREKGLALLEDSAQAHGARIGHRSVGTWGTATFSFYPSKNMTTSEGGMVLTNDAGVAERLRLIRNQGMSAQYQHELLGLNFRMTELCAAIGLQQLERLPAWTERRIANATFYSEQLQSVHVPHVRDGYTHVFHQYTVRVPPGVARDPLVKRLNERGIGARVYYPSALNRLPVFEPLGAGGQTAPRAERASQEVFSLPIHPSLTDDELRFVVEGVNASC